MASQFQLIMRTGPTPGATFTLEGDQINIGRDSTNEVTINDAEVSRHHARLTFQGGKYVLEDLGSTNGTRLNKEKVSIPTVVISGDKIDCGKASITINLGTDSTNPPTQRIPNPGDSE